MSDLQANLDLQAERHFWGLKEQPFFLVLQS